MNYEAVLKKRLEEEKAQVEELSGEVTRLQGMLEAANRRVRDLDETNKRLTKQQRLLEHALSPSDSKV